MASISLDNGHHYTSAADAMPKIEELGLWDNLADMMDDDIRESVHNDIAPCTEEEFLTEYLNRASNDLVIG